MTPRVRPAGRTTRLTRDIQDHLWPGAHTHLWGGAIFRSAVCCIGHINCCPEGLTAANANLSFHFTSQKSPDETLPTAPGQTESKDTSQTDGTGDSIYFNFSNVNCMR